MAENSGIEWTTHTCNFWWGCVKVSPGCTHCYAETLSKRYGENIWGPQNPRRRTKSPWKDIRKWNKNANGETVYVFVQSMSDFFEDHPQPNLWRDEAMDILEECSNLTIQLLTKRIGNVSSMASRWMGNWPEHIWIGTSIEDQTRAIERTAHLLDIPAQIRFVSAEPLLGSVDLTRINVLGTPDYIDALRGTRISDYSSRAHLNRYDLGKIDWVIAGGESGPGKRHMKLDWARSLRDQCEEAKVPLFFKQIDKVIPIPNDLMIKGFPVVQRDNSETF